MRQTHVIDYPSDHRERFWWPRVKNRLLGGTVGIAAPR
jgi:hypothetical protein